MKINLFESIIGFMVILIAIIFFYYAYNTSGQKSNSNSYELNASFTQVSGLVTGADVRLSGIKIGSVSKQELDIEFYDAIVTMQIDNNIKIPSDSSAKISAEGLLGGYFIMIEPGGSETMLEDGESIELTQGSIDLIGLLGEAVFGSM